MKKLPFKNPKTVFARLTNMLASRPRHELRNLKANVDAGTSILCGKDGYLYVHPAKVAA